MCYNGFTVKQQREESKMSYDTYEEFSDEMSDILSSGGGFEVEEFHEIHITNLLAGMDRDSVIEHLNLFYADLDPSELREGELGMVADIVSNLNSDQEEVEADFRIIFN
jgi:hypothetical protein